MMITGAVQPGRVRGNMLSDTHCDRMAKAERTRKITRPGASIIVLSSFRPNVTSHMNVPVPR